MTAYKKSSELLTTEIIIGQNGSGIPEQNCAQESKQTKFIQKKQVKCRLLRMSKSVMKVEGLLRNGHQYVSKINITNEKIAVHISSVIWWRLELYQIKKTVLYYRSVSINSSCPLKQTKLTVSGQKGLIHLRFFSRQKLL